MINIKNLKKIYDNGYEALKSVNLDIKEGALVTLLGPSGCGKSTILNIIAGILDPTDGDIEFDGESIVNKHPKDRDIGMVFQNYALYPHMTVLENIIFPLVVGEHKIKKEEAIKLAQKYMDLTYITDIQNKRPKEISGGQQQRVAIARALVKNPKTLLLDEPLSNLDARLRLSIREEIRNIVKTVGVTTIFVTHDQEEALSISDYIALMDKGVIQQYDIPQNLYLEPANLFVAKFIGNPIINIYDVENKGDVFANGDLLIYKEKLIDSRKKSDLSGKTYQVGIRPEHFKLDPNGDLEIEVESREMIGRYMILHFNLNGQASRMVVDSALAINPKDKVRVAVDHKAIYLFTEDGERVY